MADPTGANLTNFEVTVIERADPLDQTYKLSERMQSLRTDVDDINADAASTTAVLAALAAADGDVAINDQQLTGCTGVTADGGGAFSVICETGQDAMLVASTGTKVSWNQTGVSFFGAATVAQAAHIANPSDLASSITAINAILVVLENLGIKATS